MLHQPVHILGNLFVGDLGVDLCTGNGRMSHHLGNTFYRDACLQSQRSEAMSSNVPSQRSTNATRQAHCFEVGGEFAFAHCIGEYLVVSFAFLLCVERKYLFRYRMQRYQDLHFRFLSCLADIPLPFAVRFDLRSSQALQVGKC